MALSPAARRAGLYLLGCAVLAGGLLGAIAVYRAAGEAPAMVLGYEGGEGTAYPVLPGDSKRYQRDMMVIGSTFNLLLEDLRQFFAGAGGGRVLAAVLGLAAAAAGFVIFRAAERPPGSGG